jgi:hypothetical protein
VSAEPIDWDGIEQAEAPAEVIAMVNIAAAAMCDGRAYTGILTMKRTSWDSMPETLREHAEASVLAVAASRAKNAGATDPVTVLLPPLFYDMKLGDET